MKISAMLDVKLMTAPAAKKMLSSNMGTGRGLVIWQLTISKGGSNG
jgi:hypothetical protein